MSDVRSIAAELTNWLADHRYDTSSTATEEANWAVARRRTQRLLTTIGIYIAIEAFPGLTMDGMIGFTEAAIDHALATRTGRARGLQAGEAVFPVALSDAVDKSAREWVMENMPHRFAALVHPVVVDTSRGDVLYRTRRRIGGAFYFRFTKGVIETDIVPGVRLGDR